ncbi:MAG: apolipoprotein acyltransferase [Gammaproteobacteria bacterium]|nr:MAG: apolipoprotein acyltransferase [Gammaproteobacteria bacterium]
MSRILHVAAVQRRIGPDPQENLAALLADIERAAAAGARLVVLPELHNTPYFCWTQDAAHFDLAEPIPGPTCAALSEAAAAHGVVVVGSLFERRAAGLYHNTAVVFDRDGRLAGRYRKMHIPDDPGYNEKYYFTPGDLGFEPIDTAVGRLGVLVCWDQWYPEAARSMALAGAELLIYPTAIGWNPQDPPEEQARQLAAWQLVQRGHAVANVLPLVAVNRCGTERDGGDRFWGHSFVCGPQGELIAEAGETPTLLEAQIDLDRCETLRRTWPFLRDRRIDAYAGLLERFRG